METPPPNDSLQASLSSPVGGRLRSFRRDWLTNECSDVLNIITNGYVLLFISKPNLVRAPLIRSVTRPFKKTTLWPLVSSLVFSFVGYEYHPDLVLVKPTQERWLKLQDLILRLKSKHVLTARCLMSLIGLLASTEKMFPEGRLHMRPFQFHLKEHWRFPQSLDTLPPWTETISAHLEWWQNPTNLMKGADLHPKDNSIQLFTDASNEGWGTHLEQTSTKDLWSDMEKKATHKCSRADGSFSGPSKVQGPVSKPNSVGCYGQLNSISLHKRTRRNPLGGDVRSPVENHDLVPSLQDSIKSQTHSRMSECDGRPTVHVKPKPVNRMVTASAGVQTDLSQVVHPSCRSVCHSSEQQTATVRVSSPRPECLGHML